MTKTKAPNKEGPTMARRSTSGSPRGGRPFVDAQNLARDIAQALMARTIPSDLRLRPEEAQCFSAAWRAASSIVDDLSASEWQVYRRLGLSREGPLLEDDLHWILNYQPNPQTTGIAFKQSLLWSCMHYGNGFAEVDRFEAAPGSVGRPRALWFLDPTRMTVDDSGDELVYAYRDPGGGQIVYPAGSILHVRGPSQNGITGLALFDIAAKAISAGIAAERHTLTYFGNNATTGLVVELPRDFRDADEETAYKDAFTAQRGGVGNSYKTAFVAPGTKFSTISHNAEQAQLVEARNFMVEDVLRVFNVPGHKAGVAASSQGWGKNLAEMGVNYVRSTLAPWAKSIEAECMLKLTGPRSPKYIHVDTMWLTRGDHMTESQADEIDVRNGVMNRNEVRALRGLGNIPGGDVYTVQSGVVELDPDNLTAPSPSEAPAAPADGTPDAGPMDGQAGGETPSEQDVGDVEVNAK